MQQDEYKSVVGLDQVHASLVTQDDASAYVADSPEYFAPSIEATAEPESSLETQYADNQAFDVSSSEGVTKLTLTTTAIPIEVLAKYLGKVFDTASGRMFDQGGNATPPDATLSFRSMKSNGKYKYFQYLKGKFSVPGDEASTKETKATPKPAKIIFTAINTVHEFDLGDVTKSIKRIVGDEDTTNFNGNGFFTQVQVPSITTPAAVALSSSVPVNAATGVAKTGTFTLTFNNAMAADVVNAVTLLNATPAIVSVTWALDATKKILTGTYTNLAATTAHTLVISGATDIYGLVLANTIVKFTTAA